jgi:hypothetical protein
VKKRVKIIQDAGPVAFPGATIMKISEIKDSRHLELPREIDPDKFQIVELLEFEFSYSLAQK